MRIAKKAIAAVVILTVSCGWWANRPCKADEIQLTKNQHDRPSQSLPINSSTQPTRLPGVVDSNHTPTFLAVRSFKIPFSVETAGSGAVHVRLYVRRGSADQWQFVDSKPSRFSDFEFTSEQDGEYWFATETVAANQKSLPGRPVEPVSLTEKSTQLRVVVDTSPPIIQLNADVDADGETTGNISVDDATPVIETRLFYATDLDQQWQEFSVDFDGKQGDFSLPLPREYRQVSIYATATDSAGNQATSTKQLVRPRIASSDLYIRPAPAAMATLRNPIVQLDRKKNEQDTVSATPQQRDDRLAQAPSFGLGRLRGGQANLSPIRLPQPTLNEMPPHRQRPSVVGIPISGPTYGFAQAPVELPAPATAEQVGNGFGLNAPQINDHRLGGAVDSPPPSTSLPAMNRPATAAEAMRPITNQPASRFAPSPRETAADSLPVRPAAPRPTWTSTTSTAADSPPADLKAEEQPSFSLPTDETQSAKRVANSDFDIASFADRIPMRYSDSNQFSLEYEVESIGRIGVESVELYGSTDGGKTWKFWGKDPDRASPFDIETKTEGAFGFRIVVVGANGLASPRPLSGEQPDIFVIVDQTAPKVRITGAQYGQGERVGSLIIQYQCEDENLLPRPITLSYSQSLDGPWMTIAGGLRNDGDYVWPADPRLPRQMYLRIDATDSAGNVGSYLLEQPIDTQGLAPRARIRGFQPISGLSMPSDHEQTATGTRTTF